MTLLVGSAPNQVPTNQHLGTSAFIDALQLPISTQQQSALDAKASLTGTETLTNKTADGLVLNNGYTEEVYAVTGTTPALSPANGSIQTWALSATSTPTFGAFNAGQSILLMITASSYSINWPTVSWSKVGGSGTAPTLTSSGQTCVILWKVGSTVYGALLGTV